MPRSVVEGKTNKQNNKLAIPKSKSSMIHQSSTSRSSSSTSLPLPRSTTDTFGHGHAAGIHSHNNTTSSSSIRERIPSDSSTAVSHTCYEVEDKSINAEKGIPAASFVVPAGDNTAPLSQHHCGRARAYGTHLAADQPGALSPSSTTTLSARRDPSILLATSSAPRYPYAPLTAEQRKLAIMHRNSVDKRSIVPILYFLAASLGKLILGFGVSLAIKGEYAHKKTEFGVGLGLAISGLLAVIAAALGFGAAVSMINKRWGVIFKCFSIGGGLFISLGYALKQYFVSDDKPIFSIRLSFIPLALGTAMMGISLPNFTAYTELYRGRVVWFPIRHRPVISLLCLSPSMGILFGGWISAEVAHWPTAFNSAVLTFAVALGYAGVAMFWSDHLRSRAELYDVLLSREDEVESLESMRRRELDDGDSSAAAVVVVSDGDGSKEAKGDLTISPDMTRVPTQESNYGTPTITTFPSQDVHAR